LFAIDSVHEDAIGFEDNMGELVVDFSGFNFNQVFDGFEHGNYETEHVNGNIFFMY